MKNKYIIEVDESEIIECWSKQGVEEIGYQEYVLKSCPNIKVKPYDEIPQGRWVSVSEKLPPNYIICLFCDTDGNIFYGHRKSNNLWYEEYQTDSISDVIAWQELPEPYKKGGAKE